jgi:hypothetical protein
VQLTFTFLQQLVVAVVVWVFIETTVLPAVVVVQQTYLVIKLQ